jgi:hypothetical protein
VTGKPVLPRQLTCYEARNFASWRDGQCGTEGKFWEPRGVP